MVGKNRIIGQKEALFHLSSQQEEFALLNNPDFIHPSFEIVPVAPKLDSLPNGLSAVVMDMDGTTTTTEELCLHSLEHIIRSASGKFLKEEWTGFDHEADLPHVIGNSTTKHVEYLVRRYATMINQQRIAAAFIKAAVWTLLFGNDRLRKEEVKANCLMLGCAGLLDEAETIAKTLERNTFSSIDLPAYSPLVERYVSGFSAESENKLVRASIDIYYQRYHQILERIIGGESEKVSLELFGSADKHLIEPMPGIGITLALMKGWLGSEAAKLTDRLIHDYEVKSGMPFDSERRKSSEDNLIFLSEYFSSRPAKLAVVTSSIFYEANIVLADVFRLLRDQVKEWDVSAPLKEKIIQKFNSYNNVYDAVITANDSNEIRLKPHRDLYSIALHQLGVRKDEMNSVIGFEDSESGTIAIRAAGIGISVAVPFTKTTGHDLSAASHVLSGGVPEAVLMKRMFINN